MKHQRHNSAMLHCARQVFFILIFAISILITESLQARDAKFYENNENTRAAIDELHEVLRYLFPVVPHKSGFVWSGGKHQHGMVINEPRSEPRSESRYSPPVPVLSARSHRPTTSAAAARRQPSATSRGREVDESELLEPSSQPVLETKLSPNRISIGSVSNTNSDERSQVTLNRLPEQNIHQALEHLLQRQQSILGSSVSADSSSSTQIEPRRNLKTLFNLKHRDNASKTQLTPQAQPKSQQKEKYKRGPECMRKCIMQGHLHPVQCHSLC